jgi:hypothetical protein
VSNKQSPDRFLKLYQDAERKLKQKRIDKNMEESKFSSSNRLQLNISNSMSKDLVLKKFTNEFEDCLISLKLADQTTVSFEQMKSILRHMNFYGYDNQESANLIAKMWKILDPNNLNTTTKRKMREFIAAILNISEVTG